MDASAVLFSRERLSASQHPEFPCKPTRSSSYPQKDSVWQPVPPESTALATAAQTGSEKHWWTLQPYSLRAPMAITMLILPLWEIKLFSQTQLQLHRKIDFIFSNNELISFVCVCGYIPTITTTAQTSNIRGWMDDAYLMERGEGCLCQSRFKWAIWLQTPLYWVPFFIPFLLSRQ